MIPLFVHQFGIQREGTMDDTTVWDLIWGFITGKFAHYATILFFIWFFATLIGSGARHAVEHGIGAAGGLAGKGLWAATVWALKLGLNIVATTWLYFLWSLQCAWIHFWYSRRLAHANANGLRRPPAPHYPDAPGWINLFPAKKKKGGGGH